MRRCVKTAVMISMMELLTGGRERAVEAAKELIAVRSEVDPELLTKIVIDPQYKLWSKVMASYVLGFLPLAETSRHGRVLRETLSDRCASVWLRTHAAEALGNLRDKESALLLGERLLDTNEARSVRRWCIYALGEVGSAEAVEALRRFRETQPRGVLAEELASMSLA